MDIKKIILTSLIGLLICTLIVLYFLPSTKDFEIDIVEINDICQSLAREWGDIRNRDLPGLEYSLDYVVLDNNGTFLRATKDGLNEDLNSAIVNGDAIVDISLNTDKLGKLLIYNDKAELWEGFRRNSLIIIMALIILVIIFYFLYGLYLYRLIFKPFQSLQKFAHHIAAGNLDIPLEMDKGNIFGAFTESFDLMREELAISKENERRANQSKKELVASLSHDIKTPLASIKAVSEVMAVKSNNENEREQLSIINSKADQIDILINNLFNATLEELQKLELSVEEIWSTDLGKLIREADYYNKAQVSHIPQCLILADKLRLLQIIDNIISNSYKYANTRIDIKANINGQYLELEFRDYGLGIPAREIPFLFNKFYRGENSVNKSGTGLGLYISKYLINKMQGDISYKEINKGFALILKLFIP